MSFYRRSGKRLLDLVLGLPALVVAAPLLAIIAPLVRVFIGRPVLFRQLRPGRDSRPFVIYKLRTMLDHKRPDGTLAPDSERQTALGRALRKSSLDELPELVNVVRGDMSLVGPRPLLMEYLERYTPEQSRRHEVAPGITGWAQINGRNATTWAKRFELDVWYVDHVSLWLDLKILAVTAWKVLRRQGIGAPGHATMPRFLGGEDE